MNHCYYKIRRFSLVFLACSFVGSNAEALAQVVVGAPRLSQSTAETRTTPAAGSPGSLSTISSILNKQGPLIQWGPLAVRPYTNYSIEYGSGFLRVPGEPVNSTRQTLRQGLLFELGKTWVLDGMLSRSMYSSRLLEDTFDSSIQLSGRWTYDDWSFGVSHGYASNSAIVVETGGQNDERTNRTSADTSYVLGDKASVDFSASWAERLASPISRSVSWTGTDWMQTMISTWFNYHASDKVTLALGFLAGWDDLKAGNDMSYTQPQARIKWQPTSKLIMSISGGNERRHVNGEGGRNTSNPVYEATLSYSPTLTTTLSIGMSKTVANSYFNDQTVNGSQQTVNISQRLLQRFFLNVGAAQGSSEYAATNIFTFTDRDDDYESYNATISTGFLRRGSVSLSYSYSRNLSNTPGFRFSSRLFGADIGYRF